MGTFTGHIAPGLFFMSVGFWHLLNHIKLQVQQPNSYVSSPWFGTSKVRYIELYSIFLGSIVSVSMELFLVHERHQPFDPDGTIPSNHLHNFEHSFISVTYSVYAAFAIILDKIKPKARYALTQSLQALGFGQQLFLFHFHSADHLGVEGQYHMHLQIAIAVSLITALLGVNYPRSFIISFVRSTSILCQGLWFIVTGYMLYTPSLLPKGCLIHMEEGLEKVRCKEEEALSRAKSLVNIQFSMCLIVVTIIAMSLYLVLLKFCGENINYAALSSKEMILEEELDDVESANNDQTDDSKRFIHMGRNLGPIYIER
ncbi:hypothetical protein K2173_014379 [Erythroxylum novogranatense]|uniref:Uncharacterized protein n=1 Tax=Erythroxylum novogranatense TaxID=1862640 RepID=A0AAV8S675_9ROSI|nr:hypothetical protein K2173_014379 [Erythroxylum novogranatense]